jgi:hypothetical protein
MANFKMIALTRPVEGREDEYHDWYQSVHLVELCTIPGVIGAQRYKMAAQLSGYDGREFLAIYDIETDDIGVTMAAIGQAAASGKMTRSDALAPGGYTVVFSEFGERVTG